MLYSERILNVWVKFHEVTLWRSSSAGCQVLSIRFWPRQDCLPHQRFALGCDGDGGRGEARRGNLILRECFTQNTSFAWIRQTFFGGGRVGVGAPQRFALGYGRVDFFAPSPNPPIQFGASRRALYCISLLVLYPSARFLRGMPSDFRARNFLC